jgi:ribosomal protein S18 acetylase RimI-like enzyme
MYRATSLDKQMVVDILTKAFYQNKSFNLIVRQDKKKESRIKKIFDYYFEIHLNNGLIYISDDKKACAMISYSDGRKQTIKSVLRDIKLLFDLGIGSALKGFRREKLVANVRPPSKYYYLLFLGVHPDHQGKGKGSTLMRDITIDNSDLQLPICLETSLQSNVAFYERFGFKIYHEMEFGFPLYFMMRDLH